MSYTVKIEYDQDAESPLQFAHLFRMVCWHPRYKLGHEQPKESPSDWRDFGGHLRDAISLPLFLIDHSGISISTRDFNDSWDSGQVGWIYASDVDIRKAYGWRAITRKRRAIVEAAMRVSVEEYDTYIRGAVLAYAVMRDDEVIDSCCGFYSLDDVVEAIKSNGIVSQDDAAALNTATDAATAAFRGY